MPLRWPVCIVPCQAESLSVPVNAIIVATFRRSEHPVVTIMVRMSENSIELNLFWPFWQEVATRAEVQTSRK